MTRQRKKEREYASRGGIKLKHALYIFQIDMHERVVLDIGAGQGGFTDCLLTCGARRIYAIDVGYGVIDWKLRNNPRVKLVERCNVRYLTPEKLYGEETERANMAVVDLSFISVTKVLKPLWELFEFPREIVILVKPQFEAERRVVQKGGVIRDPSLWQIAVEKVCGALAETGWRIQGICNSPILGRAGNREFFVHGLAKEMSSRALRPVILSEVKDPPHRLRVNSARDHY